MTPTLADTLNKVALNVHNALRRMHGAPPLTLSAKMSIDAENYARYLAEENKFEHFKHLGDIGESLAFSCNTDERIPSVWKAIKDWYEEVCTKNYDFASSSQTDIKDIAHFTQIVWKSTRELGIGRSIARRGNETCTFFVARYNPSGNWLGQYKSNVLQGTFNSDICEKLDDVVEQMASLPNEEDDEEISLSPQTTALPLSAAVPQEKLDGATARPEGSLEKNDTPELRPVAEAEEVKSDQEQEKEAKPIKKPAAIKVNNSTNIGDSEDENVVGNCRFWFADVLSKFASNSLKVHNYFRKLHNSPPLEIDKELVRQAFNGAKALCISDTERRSIANKDVGENVDIACSHDDSRVSAADSVTNWYKQVCDTAYNFKTHKPAKGDSGRFTQLVWRKSKAFGTAFVTKKKTDGMFCTYAVAKYSPAGNTPGAFKDNVAQGTFSPSICSSLNTMANNAAVQAERSGNIITPAHAHLFKGLGTFKEQVDNHAIKGSLHNVANFDSKPTAQHSNHILLKQKHNPRLKVQQILGAMNKKKSLCAKAGIANGICRAALEVQSLVLHNEFRRIHEAGNLRISSELSTAARESAMKIIKDRTLGASQSGENVAVRCRASFTVQEAINDWYKEVCDSKYDFTEEGNQGASHFSQLVWKSTTSFGVGKAFGNINGAPCIVIVAKYEPAGNILGAFRDNVKQGKFKRESCDSLRKLTEEMISDQKPMAVPQAGNNTNSVVVDNKKPAMKIKKPAENNGINPKAGQHGPSKTMPGETPSGAKQPIKKPKAISNVMLIPHVPTEAEAKEFNDECLDVHNALRAMHDAEELHSSPDLVKKAQRIAEKSIIANTMSTARKRELTNSHGQNTILVCDPVKTEYTAENLILQWYKEVCTGKPFINGAYRGILDHFTQIVWKGSTQFGMAKASLSSGLGHCTIAVALYREAGNYLGQARDNVKQGDFDAEKCEFPEIILAEAREKYRELKAKPIIPPTTRSPEGLMTSPTPVTQFTEAQTTIKPIVKTMKPDADKEEEQKPTLSPKTTIMPVGKTEKPDTDKEEEQKPTPSPQTTIKPIVKTMKPDADKEEEQKPTLSPKTTIMPVGKTEKSDTDKEEEQKPTPSPQTTIKPIVKTMRPDADKEEEQKPTLSPKTTIMPVGKTEKSDTDKEEEQKPTPSPQTTIKPIVKTMKPDEVNEEEQKPTTKPKTTKVPTIKTVKPNGDEEEDQKPTTKPKTTVATTVKTEKPNEDSDDNVKPTASPKTTQDPRVPVSSNIENETHTAGTNATDDGYASQGLEAHNTFRKIHNANEMVLDNEMSVGCEEYAKTLARSDSFVLQHSDSEDGENIAFKCAPASEMSGKEATKNWYEEVCNKDYDFSSNIHTTSTGHYTQVVWKSSKKFGIGRHVKRKGPLICTYVVARYRPPGNVDGKYNDNVKRGSFDKDETCKKLDELAGIKADKRTIIKPTIKRNKVESNRELPTSRIVNEEAGDANLNVRA
eukprot:gene19050-20963_t